MVSGLRNWISNPGSLIPAELRQAGEGDVVKIDLNRPMAEILKELDQISCIYSSVTERYYHRWP